jgi:PhzF family phenazine biosynthesis protein
MKSQVSPNLAFWRPPGQRIAVRTAPAIFAAIFQLPLTLRFKEDRLKLPMYYVDAFAENVFQGNPAAVCPLEDWIDEAKMQAIAAENNLSETAYFVRRGEHFGLRWFTPRCEVDLCGHATLASALVLFGRIDTSRKSVQFETRSGSLMVHRDGDLLAMDFPAAPPWLASNIPADVLDGLTPAPHAVWQGKSNFFAIYKSEADVRAVRPNFSRLERLHPFGVCITAPGDHSDFVSRYFAPSYGIPEDPVTGSTHCSLTPYWSQQLEKTKLHAYQVSVRSGELWCELAGPRVLIKGKAVLYMEGEISV